MGRVAAFADDGCRSLKFAAGVKAERPRCHLQVAWCRVRCSASSLALWLAQLRSSLCLAGRYHVGRWAGSSQDMHGWHETPAWSAEKHGARKWLLLAHLVDSRMCVGERRIAWTDFDAFLFRSSLSSCFTFRQTTSNQPMFLQTSREHSRPRCTSARLVGMFHLSLSLLCCSSPDLFIDPPAFLVGHTTTTTRRLSSCFGHSLCSVGRHVEP